MKVIAKKNFHNLKIFLVKIKDFRIQIQIQIYNYKFNNQFYNNNKIFLFKIINKIIFSSKIII